MRYILDPNKSEQLLYTEALNCTLDPHDAYLQMKAVYEMYSGHSFDEPKPKVGNGRVKAIHYIQSFSPDDNVSPEVAHKIAKAFVIKTFGKEVQAVIATHVNTKCVHNHIIINSYSISGQKFYANKDSLKRVRKYSDAVSRAFDIEPSPNFKGGGKYISNAEYQHIKRGTSWKEQIRQAIEKMLPTVNSLDDLLAELERQGYEIKHGKYISVKAPEQMRFVRLKTLGVDYTEEALKGRILLRMAGSENALEHFTNSEIEQAYIAVIGEVHILAEQKRKVPRRQNTNAPYAPNNDFDIHRLSAQLTILNRDNIGSIGELEGRIANLKKEYENSTSEELRSKLIVYSDIRDTYYAISKGDYIAKLVEEERKRIEENNKPKKKKGR